MNRGWLWVKAILFSQMKIPTKTVLFLRKNMVDGWVDWWMGGWMLEVKAVFSGCHLKGMDLFICYFSTQTINLQRHRSALSRI